MVSEDITNNEKTEPFAVKPGQNLILSEASLMSCPTTLRHSVSQGFTLRNHLLFDNKTDLIRDIFHGLSARRKTISCRFFYDEAGSILFDEITRLPEYYLTRTELSILKSRAQSIIGDFKNLDIIDLGSGNSVKISALLDAIPEEKIPDIIYFPVDIDQYVLRRSAEMLSFQYPGLHTQAIVADFVKHLTTLPGDHKKLICLFGSTIGNLSFRHAQKFILNLKKMMHPGDTFLLGIDMVKNAEVLNKAYNDGAGITGLFNRNILRVVNHVAGTDFNPEEFEHLAFYNARKNRIEMYLTAMRETEISSNYFPGKITVRQGEAIHTENSYKYTQEDIEEFALVSGLKIDKVYSDSRHWFSLILFKCIS